mgnify:CR=1 FL=1
MEIDNHELHGQSPITSPEQTYKPSPLRRAGQVGLAILNPFSDLMVIYRTGIQPAVAKLRILRAQLKRTHVSSEQLSWAQAVERSGRPVEQLQKAFRRKRIAWWSVMLVTGSLSLLLLLMILANLGLPTVTIIKAVVTDAVLVTAALFSFVKVLEANYRLWQLATHRVSLEELGAFQDYKAENSLWLQVVTVISKY